MLTSGNTCEARKVSTVRAVLNEIEAQIDNIVSKLEAIETVVVAPKQEIACCDCPVPTPVTLTDMLNLIWQKLDWINTRATNLRDALQETLGDDIHLI